MKIILACLGFILLLIGPFVAVYILGAIEHEVIGLLCVLCYTFLVFGVFVVCIEYDTIGDNNA